MTFRLVRLGLLALGAAAAASAAPASAPIRIASEKIADRVWAAPTPGGANVGWFVVGDAVVAVDSGAGPEVGRALLAEIQKTAGRKPRYLVVTHAHRDHGGGAAAFAAAGVQVVSAERAGPGVLAVLRGAPTAAGAGRASAVPVLLTVSERSLFVGETERAEIDYLGPGHTQGDLVVVLPDRGVLFSGDLALNGVLPYLRSADVDPPGWEKILPRLAALPIQKMVPGHGAIGPREGIADTAAYVRRVAEIGQKIVLTNLPETMWEAQARAPENVIENVRPTPDHIANIKAVAQYFKARRDAVSPAPPAGTTPPGPPAPTPSSP